MIRALSTAATGMQAQQSQIDVVANNLANVNTSGYKRSSSDFQDLMYQTLRSPGAVVGNGNQLPTGLQMGQGVRQVATYKLFTMGDLKQTGNPMDLAIEGQGFFQVQMPSGDPAYTRAGAFRTDAQGRIVTANGMPLEPQITIPPETVQMTIDPNGIISVQLAGQQEMQQLGTIQVVNFANPAGLRAMGRNLYEGTDASGQPILANPGDQGTGTLQQGMLEMSNVKVVEEMIEMISSQRAYELNAKVIQTADQMLQQVTRMR